MHSGKNAVTHHHTLHFEQCSKLGILEDPSNVSTKCGTPLSRFRERQANFPDSLEKKWILSQFCKTQRLNNSVSKAQTSWKLRFWNPFEDGVRKKTDLGVRVWCCWRRIEVVRSEGERRSKSNGWASPLLLNAELVRWA